MPVGIGRKDAMKSIREALEEELQQGKLDYIREDLKRFLEKNQGAIQRLLSQDLAGLADGITRIIRRKQINEASRFDLAVRLLVKQYRSINPARDIKLQLVEVSREIWLEGERLCRAPTREDQNRVAKEWNERYGSHFRDWLLLRVLFVFEKFQYEFQEFFTKGVPAEGEPRGKTRRTTRTRRMEGAPDAVATERPRPASEGK